MLISLLFENPAVYCMILALVVFSICCHEFMHAWVALKEGDDTAARTGHLTLNPMVQMGAFSLILAAVIGIAWGAVPTDPMRMKHKYSDALVSFAGPAANLGLFIIFVTLCAAAFQLRWENELKFFFKYGAGLNAFLIILNLLPVPPLDGFAIAKYFFPRINNLFSHEIQNGAMFVVVGVFILFSKYFFSLAFAITGYATSWIRVLFGAVGIGPMVSLG